ncbi:unnamed protein product [Medioppia subpectinata]|uniref:Protein S-acyltransferase n=1 Tax=Medioppia subpectinata TaxID=1979941 RepID=A0A7R9KM18_9ACAR|nr:unnamed protein product [Medioppia subpectinata]CAG2105743.1 unnamed protein product [Medioppia subpectinata]
MACKSVTKLIPATCAWILLLSATTAFFLFPCLYLQNAYHLSVTISQGIITFFVISNFFLATFMDPGIIKKDEDKDDDFRAPLYKNVEINGITVRMKWCVTCQFYRPPRCSHCSVCNTCIEPAALMSVKKKKEYKESLVLLAIIALLFIPIIGLTGFHIILVARGRTTNEQVTGKFQGGYNPFSRGCWSNCCYTLCGPRFPSKSAAKKKSSLAHFHQYNSLSASAATGADNSVKVYMDSTNSMFVHNSMRPNNSSHSQNYNRKTNSACPNDGISLERIESSSQSQSRDCEPSPPAHRNHMNSSMSPQFKPYPHNMSGQMAYHDYNKPQFNNADNNHSITMRRNENGKKETTFSVSGDECYNEKPTLGNQYNSQRAFSPTSSGSNTDRFTQSQSRSMTPGGGPGGMRQSPNSEDNRQSQYEMNYEISV